MIQSRLDFPDAKNAIVTIAIGDEYFKRWTMFSEPAWKDYCSRYRLSLYVVTQDLLPYESPKWKKATWQKMLIGSAIAQINHVIENVCYLDSDILINPFAPNIFTGYDSQTIALVSQVKDLPYSIDFAKRRLAFLRNKHYDSRYPLDSALFMTPKQIYEYHNLEPFENYACMGLFIFNVETHSDLMNSWFYKYDRDVDSLTGGGDEPLINYEMQNWGGISWLPYQFQAIWIFEMAVKYPFLYRGLSGDELIRECIEATLYSNYFLHFAGSWPESSMWHKVHVFQDQDARQECEDYFNYLKSPIRGIPVGLVKPLAAQKVS
jgi:hypothetical protein